MTRVQGFWMAGAAGVVAAALAYLSVGIGDDGTEAVFGAHARAERRAAELTAFEERRAREVRAVDVIARDLVNDRRSLAAAVQTLEELDLVLRTELVDTYSRLFRDGSLSEREARACYVLRKALDIAAGDPDPGRRAALAARLAAEYRALFGSAHPRVTDDGRWWVDVQGE